MLIHHMHYSDCLTKSIKEKIETSLKAVPILKRRVGKRAKQSKEKYHYKDVIMSFDIETSQYHEIKQSFMYLWQFCIGTEIVITGRTWTQFKNFLLLLESTLNENERYMIYVHNLPYEMQFLTGLFDFDGSETFAIDVRKIIKTCLVGKFEFRCSYALTNMSLAQFTEKMNVKHKKLSGDEFNYKILRFPWTPLTQKEMQYGINDVLGLNEALYKFIQIEDDDLYSIPLTNTGFVRRDARKVVRTLCHSYMVGIQAPYDVQKALMEAFRGGNTHANRYWVDAIVRNVRSADRSSSYPDVLCNREFPSSKWRFIGFAPLDVVMQKIDHHYALLMRVVIRGDIHLKDPLWGFPYISLSKCRGVDLKSKNTILDNGRILECEYLETTITDIDLSIILQQYEFDEILFPEVWMSRYKPLPEKIIRLIRKYYINKTTLKDVKGEEDFYMKEKAKLNSIYGLMVQNNMKQQLIFTKGRKDPNTGKLSEWHLDQTKTEEEILEKYIKKGFLPYQWGVWCTAWARYELEEGLRLVDPKNAIYCDTDSIKYIGDVDFTSYNEARIQNSIKHGCFAEDPSGITHYMGVFESEGESELFITQGAKKYACQNGNKVKLTCAGVSKVKGAIELMEAGGIDKFRDGFTFNNSAGVEAVYNDEIDKMITIDHHRLRITRNVYFHDSMYTLGKTQEYYILVTKLKDVLKNVIKCINLEADDESDQK